ncbi:hypothetical protein EDD21DRAFT_417847 [Dissophora ornata]|nr:hypothetical protein EDD21DRAFT_417847 [Dissophora ornata]
MSITKNQGHARSDPKNANVRKAFLLLSLLALAVDIIQGRIQLPMVSEAVRNNPNPDEATILALEWTPNMPKCHGVKLEKDVEWLSVTMRLNTAVDILTKNLESGKYFRQVSPKDFDAEELVAGFDDQRRSLCDLVMVAIIHLTKTRTWPSSSGRMTLFLAVQRFKSMSSTSTNTTEECLKAASQGDTVAQYNLGIMYYSGKGVPYGHPKRPWSGI